MKSQRECLCCCRCSCHCSCSCSCSCSNCSCCCCCCSHLQQKHKLEQNVAQKLSESFIFEPIMTVRQEREKEIERVGRGRARECWTAVTADRGEQRRATQARCTLWVAPSQLHSQMERGKSAVCHSLRGTAVYK